MRKILLGLVATAAIASPLAAATAANAAEAGTPTCTPSDAVKRVDHTEYQWAALVAKGGLHWEYKWTPTTKNPSTDLLHIWVKSLDLTKKTAPQITRTVVDVEAKDAKTCSVTLPEHFAGEGTYSVVVPFVKGVDTFLLGVQGYDEKVAITHDVTVTKAMAGQFWIGHKAQAGYVIANPNTAQWHIDFQFAGGPNDVRLLTGETASKQIVLPGEFMTEHSLLTASPGYYSTKVTVKIYNDSDRDQWADVMYADQQDDNRVWIERGVFDNWTNGNTIPAHGSKTFTFDVWYDAPIGSPAEVPDGLKLDLRVIATPVA